MHTYVRTYICGVLTKRRMYTYSLPSDLQTVIAPKNLDILGNFMDIKTSVWTLTETLVIACN